MANAPKPRVAWIDYAKGICIFFVVMLHTTHYVEEYRNYQGGWIDHLVAFALPFRMPDFFLIAGLFFANVVNRPWRSYLDSKAAHFYYFYVLWVSIVFIAFDIRISALEKNWSNVGELFHDYLLEFINPKYPLWFIHSLPIYFIIVRLLRGANQWLVWFIAAALQIAYQASYIHTGYTVIDQGCSRFVYFYTGCICAPYVFRFSEWATKFPSYASLYLVGWATVNGLLVYLGVSTKPFVGLALGYVGALAVISVSCLFAQSNRFDYVRFLGQNSIVVYLGFMIPMAFFERLFRYKIHDIGSTAMLVTILSVAVSAMMYLLATRTPFRFLYVRPLWARLSGRAQGESARD